MNKYIHKHPQSVAIYLVVFITLENMLRIVAKLIVVSGSLFEEDKKEFKQSAFTTPS